jgi:hypothetical protein
VAKQRRRRKGLQAYDWVSWLTDRDAPVLLVALMGAIEAGDDLQVVRRMIKDWRKNAHGALTAENYTVRIDGFLEVHVDARLFLLRRGGMP